MSMRKDKVADIIEDSQVEINVTKKENIEEVKTEKSGWRGAEGWQGRKKVDEDKKRKHKLGGYFSDDDKKKLEQAMALEGIDVKKKTSYAELIRKCVSSHLFRQGIILDN